MPQTYPGTRSRSVFTANKTNKAGATYKQRPSDKMASSYTHKKLRKAELVKLAQAEHQMQEDNKRKPKQVEDAAAADGDDA